MITIKPRLLLGSRIQLEPFQESHRDELNAAAQDESIWTYNGVKAFGARFNPWFDKALRKMNEQTELPFVIRRLADKKIMGSTRYYDICAEHHRLMIGYTWLIPEVWGTFVNPESKYLLLKYAFEDSGVNRIQFFTDARNARSRAAIKKLGAMEEGLMREHMILEDGFVRDTYVFSIIGREWGEVKERLELRIK